MKRDEILAMVVKIGKDVVPDLKNTDVDANKTYRDLGINSLDLMEVVTRAQKELKVKVSGDQLAKVNTVNGLVDLFVKASG